SCRRDRRVRTGGILGGRIQLLGLLPAFACALPGNKRGAEKKRRTACHRLLYKGSGGGGTRGAPGCSDISLAGAPGNGGTPGRRGVGDDQWKVAASDQRDICFYPGYLQ